MLDTVTILTEYSNYRSLNGEQFFCVHFPNSVTEYDYHRFIIAIKNIWPSAHAVFNPPTRVTDIDTTTIIYDIMIGFYNEEDRAAFILQMESSNGRLEIKI